MAVFKVPSGIPVPIESTYCLLTASVERVGVARLVIFYEFIERLAVGAVILLRTVVLR